MLICGFRGGNHSITAGILVGEGTVIPGQICDISYLFELVRTNGFDWFVSVKRVVAVSRRF